MTKELKQEYTRKITQANKTQLITILYEMLMLYVEEAKAAHEKEDRMGFREGIRKARGCINELLNSLNFDYQLAVNFLQLYNAYKVIKGLHGAYEKLGSMDTSGPVMENVQTVYAGLTYGRNNLVENFTDQGTNRGFRA